ncbi:glycosyltransferase family 4 protein [Sunxiuqinia sp. A32]|uniref:glycosyltransferase family 4 protein n=1 Tax=Sunxiuqinia sp. A32 TaxID=3461496 RepID=UPI004046642D
MKILQLTNKVPWPPKDGGAIATLMLTKGFMLLGHQVTVLAMNTLKHHIKEDNIPEHLRKSINFQLVDVPAKITNWGMLSNLLFSELPYNAVRFIDENYSRKLIQLLDETNFDIIQLEGLYLCPYIPLIRKHSNALISYRAHNVEFEIWERSASLSPGLKKLYLKILSRRIKKFELSLLNDYDAMVSITERDGAILDELGNERPRHTTQTGVDLSYLVPKAKDLEYPSLFHIGALDWSPNQEGLIWFLDKCWSKIKALHPDLNFYIAGRNAPEWFVKKIKSCNIQYMGEVDDAYHFMNSKAIMIVPLNSGSGMRVKIIEGMALGKAIVSTCIGSEGIPTTHEKNILIANDEDSFVSEIGRLINDRSLYDTLCKNSVSFIHDKFNNLTITGDLINFYKKHIHD